MQRIRPIPTASLVTVLMLAGCASPGGSGRGSTSPTPGTRLELAAPGQADSRQLGSGQLGSGQLDKDSPTYDPAIAVRPTTYVLDAALPDLGSDATVWRMQPHPVSASDVQRFADVLGLETVPARTSTGWEVHGSDGWLSVVVGPGSVGVSYSQGGGVSSGSGGSSVGSAVPGTAVDGPAPEPVRGGKPVPVTDASPPPVAPPDLPSATPVAAPSDVPSAGEASSIARDLLDRLGVLAGQDWAIAVSDAGGVAYACASDAPCAPPPPQVFARAVTFAPKVAGSVVSGGGWSVTLGEHGRVESVYGDWAAPADVGTYPLITTSAAFADLQHGRALYVGPQPMIADAVPPVRTGPDSAPSQTAEPETVHITGVELGLARWDGYLDDQAAVDLVPTYRFQAVSGDAARYDIEVLALDPSAITFHHPVPMPKPLPAQPPSTTD